MNLEIVSNRVRKPADLDFLLELAFNNFKKPNGCKTKEEYRRLMQPWMENPAQGIVMAYNDQSPVGFALHCEPSHHEAEMYSDIVTKKVIPPFNYEYSRARTIEMIVVEEGHRGRGIGKVIATRVIEDCERIGTKQLFAVCWKGMEGPSYHLFMKLGFMDLCLCPKYYQDGASGVVVLKQL